MALHHRLEATLATTVPTRTSDLGLNNPHGFTPLHRATAARCLEARGLLPTRLILNRPDAPVLGDPNLLSRRMCSPMPKGYHGHMADYVPLAPTPKTASLYASTSLKPPAGPARVRDTDIVIASVSLDRLMRSGIPLIYCDRSPHHRNTAMSSKIRLENAAWDLLQGAKFSARDAEPDRLSRYHAEILAYGLLPLELVQFAVKDEDASARLRKQASDLGVDDIGIVVRPDFFFGGR